MSDDLVALLGALNTHPETVVRHITNNAKDRIEAQAAEIERLREATNRTYDKAYWAGVEDGKRAALAGKAEQ